MLTKISNTEKTVTFTRSDFFPFQQLLIFQEQTSGSLHTKTPPWITIATQSSVQTLGSMLLTMRLHKTPAVRWQGERNMLLQEQGATLLITPLGLGPFLTKGLNILAQSPEM